MRVRKLLSLVLCAAIIFSAVPFFNVASAAGSPVTVNWNVEHQEMEGVGAAYAFNSGNMFLQLGESGSEGQKTVQHLLDLLFSRENGTGHNIVRVIIGDGGLRPAGTQANPGWNPVNGIKADANNPGYDIEGNKIPTLGNLGQYGFTIDGNRFYNGTTDSWWPNEPLNEDGSTKLTAEGGINAESGFAWQLPQWNQPIAGDVGGHTNVVADKAEYVYNQPINVKESARTMKELFDVDQVMIMRHAVNYGIETFYACAWTPPYWMKDSFSMFGSDGGSATDYLRTTEVDGKKIYFQAYADYLAATVIGYWKEFGIPITHVGPWNESEANHGYSGYRFRNADEIAELINDYIGPTFNKYFNTTDGLYKDLESPSGKKLYFYPKVVGPEGTNVGASVRDGATAMNIEGTGPKGGNPNIDTFSTHLYGSANMGSATAKYAGGLGTNPYTTGSSWPEWVGRYSIWQTEYMRQAGQSQASQNTQKYFANSIVDGMQLARLVANSFLSDPAFNAYLFWIGFDNNGADGSDLIRMQTNGSIQNSGNIGTLTGNYRVFKRTYTFGHFSRFINPGSVRIGVDNVTPTTDVAVLATADKDEGAWGKDGKDFSITVTNNDLFTDDFKTLDFTLENFPAGVDSVTVFRTSASENMIKLAPIAVVDGKFSVDIPSGSIITIVPTAGEYATFKSLTDVFERDIFSTLETNRNEGGVTATEAGQAGRANEAAAMSNGDYIKYANMYFSDASANGGITRRHLLYLTALAKPGANGGVLKAYVTEPGTEINGTADILAKGSPVGEILIPAGDSWNTYMAKLDTGTDAPGDTKLSAYGLKDFYLVAIGFEGDTLFTVNRFGFSADDTGSNSSTVSTHGNLLSNGNFETATASTSAGWTGLNSGIGAHDVQNYSGLGKQLSNDQGFSLRVIPTEAGGGAYTSVSGMTPGELYTFNAFVLDDPYAGTSVNQVSAALEYYNGDTLLGSTALVTDLSLIHLPARGAYGRAMNASTAAMNGTEPSLTGIPFSPSSAQPTSIEIMDWTQLNATFTYNPPAETTSVRLVITGKDNKTFFIDEVSVINTPDRIALINLINAYEKAGLDSETLESLKSQLTSSSVKVSDLIKEAEESIVESNPEAMLSADLDLSDNELTFAASISNLPQFATVNGEQIAISLSDDFRTIIFDGDVEPGSIIHVSGVTYSNIFQGFVFSFAIGS